MGADRRVIIAMVLRAVGLFAGTVLSLASARAVAALLFGLKPTDWKTLLAAAGMLSLVALAASYLPARRAANLDPTKSLRAE